MIYSTNPSQRWFIGRLGIKMTDGQGFIEAATQLLLREITARNSYESRHSRHQADLVEALLSLGTHLGDSKKRVEDVVRATDHVSTLLDDLVQESAKERDRRQQLSTNAGIIGEDIISALTEKDAGVEDTENVLMGYLNVFNEEKRIFKSKLVVLWHEFEEKKTQIMERRKGTLDVAIERFEKQKLHMCNTLKSHLNRLVGHAQSSQKTLKEARKRLQSCHVAALELLERKGAAMERELEQGLFRGLDPDLAAAVRLFLGREYARLMDANGNIVGFGVGGGAPGVADDFMLEGETAPEDEEIEVPEYQVKAEFQEWVEDNLQNKQDEFEDIARRLVQEHEEAQQKYEAKRDLDKERQKELLRQKLAERKLQRTLFSRGTGFTVTEVELEEEFEVWKDEMMEIKRESLMFELQDISDEVEVERVTAHHVMITEQFEEQLMIERPHQIQKLRQKIIQRRKQKAAKMMVLSELPTEVELEEEWLVWREQAIELKQEQLEEVAKREVFPKAQKILRQRHAKMLQQYEVRLDSERAERVEVLRKQVVDRRRARAVDALLLEEQNGGEITEEELQLEYIAWKEQALEIKRSQLALMLVKETDEAKAELLVMQHSEIINEYKAQLESEEVQQKVNLRRALTKKREQRAGQPMKAERCVMAAEVDLEYSEWKAQAPEIKRAELDSAMERARATDSAHAQQLVRDHAEALQQYEARLLCSETLQRDKLAARLAQRKARRLAGGGQPRSKTPGKWTRSLKSGSSSVSRRSSRLWIPSWPLRRTKLERWS